MYSARQHQHQHTVLQSVNMHTTQLLIRFFSNVGLWRFTAAKTLPRYSSEPHGNPFQHRHSVTKGEQLSRASENPRNGTHIHTHAHWLRVEKEERI
uniref:Uncharacterized protein n=1 Tax=Rhipicephalus appendiculatus TaxID=34631 RepID=A0A131YGV5_RHIAP